MRLDAAARSRRRIRAVNRFGRWLRRIGVVTGVLALLAVVLGVVGRLQVPATDPAGDVSLVTVAYGTAGLFAFAGTDVADVPAALAVARLVAPLATVTAAVGLLLAAGRTRAAPWVARRAHDHHLLIGTAGRLEAHVAERESLVHADTAQDGRHVEDALHVPVEDVLHVPTDPTVEDWLVRVGVAAAREVVVATGEDATNLALLGRIRPHQDARPDLRVVVEIDDRATAIRASILLGTERPSHLAEVICREDALAAGAAASVFAGLAVGEPVVVVGDGAVVPGLATHLARLLVKRDKRDSARRSILGLLLSEDDDRGTAARVGRPAEIDVRHVRTVEEALALGTGRITFVIAHADEQVGIERAIEIVAGPRDAAVHVVSRATDLPFGIDAIPLSTTPAGRLADWWTQAAQAWAARRTGAAGADRDVEALARDIRGVVADLVVAGWRAVPADATVRGAQSLGAGLLADIGRSDEWRELPHTLETVGIALIKPRPAPPTAEEAP